MKVITRTVYVSKKELELIEKDINAVNYYSVFSNKETDTIEVEMSLTVMEEFIVAEDTLELIIEGLLPTLSESELRTKKEQVKAHLRSLGLTT